MQLDDVRSQAQRLGAWAHLATMTPNGEPHVAPVHPCWEGDVLWTMSGLGSVKVRNLRAHPAVMLHWQVSDQTGFDSLIVWGDTTIHDDLDTKRRLWNGVFDYDLRMFSPGGPEGSPDLCFIALHPTKAVLLEFFGQKGRQEWRRD